MFSPIIKDCDNTMIGENIQCLLQKQEICSCKSLRTKLNIFFSLKNTEDVLTEDTGKTLENIYLPSVQ